jgi:hypothetical protein
MIFQAPVHFIFLTIKSSIRVEETLYQMDMYNINSCTTQDQLGLNRGERMFWRCRQVQCTETCNNLEAENAGITKALNGD